MSARRVRWALDSVANSSGITENKFSGLWALRSNKGSRRNLHSHSRWHCHVHSLVRDWQDRTLPLPSGTRSPCRRPAFDLQTTSLNRGSSCTLAGVALSDCGLKDPHIDLNDSAQNQRFPACGFEILLQARMVTSVIWTEDIDHALIDDFPAVAAVAVVAGYASALSVHSRPRLRWPPTTRAE
jgi:hypothetical protein